MKSGEYVPALSARAYTATLYVMVIRVKGLRLAPPPSPARADFSIIMECTLEIGNCHSAEWQLPICVLCGKNDLVMMNDLSGFGKE
jgi:hypothetical protein